MARKTQKPLLAKVGPDHPYAEIIAGAYRVFRYPAPTDTGVCKGCCMNPDVEAAFFEPDIEEMPLHYIRDWFFAACDRPIAKSLWAYLLPRVLEVLACGEDPSSVGPEVSLCRFPTGDRAQWNDAEWDVLNAFQRAYLGDALRKTEPYLDDMICMFGIAGWPLDDLLWQVADAPDDLLARRLWSDWCIGHPSIWISAFWEGDGGEQALNFYRSRTLCDRMEAVALSDDTSPDLAEQAFAVAEVIQASRESSKQG